ncbi:MAG: DUF2169 domain-containing protein [Candidatus Electrothrix sp. AUS4]|nr:DUF2169 domain-containing protein [Candidatus Electrothrix sp. AUS4]
MELTNHTPYPARLFRGYIGDDLFIASLAVRVTYDVQKETLTISKEQTWPVSPQPWESEYGVMDSDEVFYRGGVDLFVFGQAYAPGYREALESEVTIEVGSFFKRRIAVFGDRVWEKKEDNFIISQPKPFRVIPLTPEYAYGGKDEWDELEISFPDNPDGKGFYLEEEQAAGNPLPNMEDPDNRIRKWDDRPTPVVMMPCPMQSPLRVQNGLEMDEQGNLIKLKPEFFNSAYPQMILDQLQSGDVIKISGMKKTGEFSFSLATTELKVRLQFDKEVIERPLTIDQIGIEVEKDRVFISYRYPFRYKFYPLQQRMCELFALSVS